MPVLSDYDQFQGYHWETGSLRNYLAYQGIKAPHTGQAYSEAMLLGVSGGIVMGYYTFDYQGIDPMVQILTRNTFDPLETIYQRLGIQTKVLQTSSPTKGEQNLIDILEAGNPAIVYADMFSLPYNAMESADGMWAMLPILVYGFDRDQDVVKIADRSKKPLSISVKDLARARGRTKKNKYRLLVHEPPGVEKLTEAVRQGLRDTIKYFTQAPPKGSKQNFGFSAYQKWADQLRNPDTQNSWAKKYASGPRMYAALKSAFYDIMIYGKDGGAERNTYALFLDEASRLLSSPGLEQIADLYRRSADAWDELARALLPDRIPVLGKTRSLMLEKHHLFLSGGDAQMEKIIEINNQLTELRGLAEVEFALDDSEADQLRNEIADQVMRVHDIESEAVEELKRVIQ